ncbi:hypothetical protein FA15DRAFT_664799 [Coprinopsis marcescibilis]|uniref:Galactose oxidase n=1 Tax=Coprinopsis marcescibilis TaxID=230819 RepID=A0A5C3L6W9_COPMA|nr:hypothetical protein FA15DRAFT_664799 [Coprinopsis marcescibilis]
MASGYFALCFIFLASLLNVYAQSTTPVPPLQWINLSPLLQGSSAPPPLRDAALGYDEDSRSLIIFGGESEGGFVQSRTFLLNLETLSWSTPQPPLNLRMSPAARSSAISGLDFAASNRHAFVVIGGKGSNDAALSDVWAYDFTNQFWSEVDISPGRRPAARWGASGGIDTRVEPIQDAILPGPNNTFYLAGGFDGQNLLPLSDVWRLNISGTLTANLPDAMRGSWEQVILSKELPGKVRQGGTVVRQRIVATGGCNMTLEDSNDDPSCAQQDAHIINTSLLSALSPGPCGPPRLDPVLFPNMNTFSSGFASQVLLALGTFNTTIWEDFSGVEGGEIDVLDVDTGSWTRIRPSGDPGSAGQAFPSLREGAAVYSSIRGLVGSVRDRVTDTIIFGGRGPGGRYLSDIWLLRAYTASLSPSVTTWPGFGDGRLRSGVNADGSGVTVEYIRRCASLRDLPQPAEPTPDKPSQPSNISHLDTSLTHKLLSGLSLGLLFFAFFLVRLYPQPLAGFKLNEIPSACLVLFVIGSYAIGIAGYAVSFTTLVSDRSPSRSADFSAKHLSTSHAIVSTVFFGLIYLVVPVLAIISAALQRIGKAPSGDTVSQTALRHLSPSPLEKPDPVRGVSHSPSLYPPPSPRPNSVSWGYSQSNPARRSAEAISLDGESITSGGPRRGFEVINRPARTRKQSETWSTSLGHSSQHPLPYTRSLGEIDWLLRRRSLSAVGELDLALSIAHNTRRHSAAQSDGLQTTGSDRSTPYAVPRPSLLDMATYVLLQIGFLGLNATTLIALWDRASTAIFVVALVWVLAIYALIIFVSKRLPPEAYLLSKLKGRAVPGPTGSGPFVPAPTSPAAADTIPPSAHGPYMHQPPYLRTVPIDPAQFSDDPVDDEDDIDDETCQRMIEEEMDRRDVSIVTTVPKRKLWVANPS